MSSSLIRNMLEFSIQMIGAGTELLTNFMNNNRYNILQALMQSGKTDTFMFVACELHRQRKITKCYIISGNCETALRDQLKQREEFRGKYGRYLASIGLDIEEILFALSFLDPAKMEVVWGSQLDKKKSQLRDTLYIWEESHTAQTKGNRPDKFFKRNNIYVDGQDNNQSLKIKNNYFLSVSATPFSEIIDCYALNQDKKRVILKPGEGYRGIKYFMDSNKLIGYSNWQDGLDTVVKELRDNTYAIIRISESHRPFAQAFLEEQGIICIRFDQVSKKDQELGNINEILDIQPGEKTVIFIKQLCRMGQQINKTHLSVVMETTYSKTDTILQGLLGRVCGYHMEDICVILNNKFICSGELERFNMMSMGEIKVPKKGMNLINKSQRCATAAADDVENQPDEDDGLATKKFYEIIPICVRKENITAELTDTVTLRQDIIAAFNSGNIENFNGEFQTETIKALVDRRNTTNFNVRRVTRENKTYDGICEEFSKKIGSRQPFKPRKSAWGSKTGTISIWIITDNYEGFRRGDVYVTFKTKSRPDEQPMLSYENAIKKLPATSHKEVFSCIRTTETHEEIVSNGIGNFDLKKETCDDEELMWNSIKEFITITMNVNFISADRSITSSLKNGGTESWVGIVVSKQILSSLRPDGYIYERVRSEFSANDITLKITTSTTRIHKDRGYKILSKIAW